MAIEAFPQVARLIDLERYPIHDLQSARCSTLIRSWREELDRTGACNLLEFLTPQGVRELAGEAEGLMVHAYRRTFTANYLYRDHAEPGLPSSHPQHRFWTTSSTHIASDQFPETSKLRQLYEWEGLTELVTQIQGKKKLYLDADEFQALNVIALAEGDRTVFHHDGVECVVTLLLQEPLAGGKFVYCPGTRAPDGTIDLEAVSAVVNEEPGKVRQLERGAGTLTLFRGGHTLHGVTPVEGEQKRITAILSYHPEPHRVGTAEQNCRLYGPRVETILIARADT